MSLRDQLLKKGLASKKDARRVDRDLKNQRKREQGSKKRKAALAREEKARLAAEKEAQAAERLAARKEREAARDRYEHALQVRNLLLGHRLKNRGGHPFHFKAKDGRTVLRMFVHPRVAEELTLGTLAIAWLDHGNRDEYLLIGRKGAEKLTEIGAENVLVHWHRGEPDASERPLHRDWDPSLRPHRVPDQPSA